MRTFYTAVFTLFVFVNCIYAASIHKVGEATLREKRQIVDIDSYLERFGYLKKINDSSRGPVTHDDASRSEAIRDFQSFNGLEVTGEIDDETISKMRQPRCGVPDQQVDTTRPLEFNAPGNKWNKHSLSWNILTPSRQLPEERQKLAIKNAFKYWSDVTPLEFPETQGNTDIEIKFASGEHGDGRGNAFDGQGGVLAHAFLPRNSHLDGDTHFDEDERWVYHSNSGTDLETVAAHEFGHALGLHHSRNPSALMAPYYRGYIPGMRLHEDDILGIQSLYGTQRDTTTTTSSSTTTTPTTTTTTTPTTTTTTPTTTTTTPTTTTTDPTTPYSGQTPGRTLCDLQTFDAISLGPDDATYVFRDVFVYKVTDEGLVSGYPKFIREVYPHSPRRVRAAVYLKSTGETFLFNHHGKIWRYKGFELQENRAMDKDSFRSAISFTTAFGSQQIYLFDKTVFWKLSRHTMNLVKGSLQISRYWGDIPSKATAAIEWHDGYFYFFENKRYTRISPYTRSGVTGYPGERAASWLESLCVAPSKPERHI